ncbi:hypothetical protein [Streptomyces qinglanensis]|uniref:hypothetical protein n=1 Tax=Streptomyces qinglanensis TaxID=943816 RepID=UPI00116091FF|nr:hypothetical protein [Streptomyces qinglanensis]
MIRYDSHLSQVGRRTPASGPARLDALLSGYQDIAPLSGEDAAALPTEIVHAALIIAFHRDYRHNIRFPDPAKSSIHNEMIQFVDSVEKATSLRG